MDIAKALATPLRQYFNPRFEALASQLQAVDGRLGRLETGPPAALIETPDPVALARLEQARLLGRVDVSQQNRWGRPPAFDVLESQAASAAQCHHPTYQAWYRLIEDVPAWPVEGPVPAGAFHRKAWEFAYIAEAITQAGLMRPGVRAVGFGVGTEPLPALFASRGLDVLATDMPPEQGDPGWEQTGQLMHDLTSLSRPYLVPDAELAERVTTRPVDMNALPADLGTFDVVWSSCVIEHLGSPTLAMDFVLESARLLEPGGILVHTTEYELTRRSDTADYGNCAVFRLVDLEQLRERVLAEGFEMTLNPYVAMDSPEDRWISLALTPHQATLPDPAHLKLAIVASVSTSFGLIVRRPAEVSRP